MRVALYARLSVAAEESVSIARQLDAGRKLAEARGFEVVLEAVDDGVSASTNKPEHRLGWRSILNSPIDYQAVIIWKVDRLARSVMDFVNTNDALERRGASIMAVEDPIDMTTDWGKMLAVILAVFAEMEAKAIGARVKAAHLQLKKDGRIPSGRVPYGYKSIDNPHGPGKVIAIDDETIPYVIEAAKRAKNGDTLYSIAKYLEDAGAPRRPNKLRKYDSLWSNTSVEAFLFSPRLAGMTPYTTGRKRGDFSLPDVLRGDDGMPVVDESTAIMTPAEWYDMHEVLKRRKFPGRLQANNAHVLAGLAKCTCLGPLHKTGKGGEYLRCTNPDCDEPTAIKRQPLEDFVLGQASKTIGHLEVLHKVVDTDTESMKLADIEHQIKDTVARMAIEDDLDPLLERLAALKQAKRELDRSPADFALKATGQTFAELLKGSIKDRRQTLIATMHKVVVSKAKVRGKFSADRIDIDWKTHPAIYQQRQQASIDAVDNIAWTS